MKKIAKVIAWMLSVFFLIFALACFKESILSFALFIICGILCNPILYSIAKIKKRIALIFVPILFIVACTVFPTTDVSNEQNDVAEQSIVIQQEESIEIETKLDVEDEENVTGNIDINEPILEKEVEKATEEFVTEELQEENNAFESSLEVHFIDVGQGDCILITCDGEAMLIDAGNNNKGTTVQLYLKKHGIEKLKYVIGTHPDSDHIGGMDVILYKYDCETVIIPDRSSDTNTYRDVIDTIEYKNYSISFPSVGNEYYLGNARFIIIGPSKDYSDDNDCSVAIKLIHGDNSFIFTGDAEEEAESDYIKSGFDLEATVLKVGHHGSRSSTSKNFLQTVNPQYAVICCGEDNSYGHPHSETLNNLREQGCKIFRTDEQGSVVAVSDGKKLTWNCSPSETWLVGDQKENQQSEVSKATNIEEKIPYEGSSTISPDTEYILNTNTKKFHYPSCSSVKDMKDKNKKESSESRDVIITQGYAPCKRCNP